MSTEHSLLPESRDAEFALGAPRTSAAELRETSGMTTLLLLTYVEREGGPEAVREVLRRAGAERLEAGLRDEGAWFSFDLKIGLFEAMAEVLGDPLATRHMGEAALDMQVATGLKVALRALGSPRLLYRNVVRANAKFTSRHAIELIDLGATSARMRFRDIAGGQIHPLDCEYTRGLLSCAPGLFGLPPARISHMCRASAGTDQCIYDISWEPGHTRALVACGAAGATALGVPALLDPSILPLGGALAAAAAALGGFALFKARRTRLRRLESELSDFRESSDRISGSLRALVSELRLEDVLANVTSYARQAIGGQEFALLVHEPGGMRCQSSSGLPARTVAALERWASGAGVPLDDTVLLDDVGIVPELESLPHEPEMPLGSLCAAPLTYRGERLGVLVALSAQRLTFLPRDVHRLQNYAMQAAIALTNARLYEAQEALATKDALTGLRNHREFHERVGHELERLRRYEGRLAIVLIDLDGFKSVNDESGHAAGDRVLKRTARAIEGASRSSDVAFRIGGDEFALMLPDASHDEATDVAHRVRAAVDAVDPRTTASFGVAVWPDDGGSKDVLLAHADGALYAAKARTRRADAGGPAAALEAGERRLAVANRLAVTLAEELDPRRIARITVRELDRSLGYVLACLLRLDDGCLHMAACAGPLTRDLPMADWVQPIEQGVNGRVARSGRSALIHESSADPDHIDIDRPGLLRSELAVPVRVAGRVWGVLSLEDTRAHAFDENDLLLVETVAAHVGSALHRAELHAGLEDAFTTTLSVLCDALEAKDLPTAGHADDVSALAVAVARRIGLDDGGCRLIGYAALMHDVGKVAVRTEVLRKPEPLEPEERIEMEQHVVVGALMLERIPFFSDVAPLVRSSHERWDGGGYPDALAGGAIPLGSRVIAACDAWHAMTSDRPYRAALPHAAAEAELRAQAGTQFDPAVVEALLAELRSGVSPGSAPRR